MRINNSKTWIGIFFLIGTEQFIKIVIYNNFFDKRFAILPPILYFEPIFNRHYSWFNSMMQIENAKWIHIIAVLALIIFIYLFYQYLYKEFGKSRIINVMFAFLFSGAFCSLIDKIFWDGSLDYILVKGFFTFDLKDVYLNVFNVLLILSMFINNKILEQIDTKVLLKDFARNILPSRKGE